MIARRAMDRMLVILFFVNFVIAIALAYVVVKANNSVVELTRITCSNQMLLDPQTPLPMCKGVVPTDEGGR